MSMLEELINHLCPDGVRWMKLGAVLKIFRGIRVVKAELSDIGYPVYQNSLAPLGYFDRFNCDANKTFVISAGAAGEVGFCNTAFWAADDCYYFNCADCGISERYLYFVLLSQQHNLLKMVRKASIPRLGRSAIENLIIPLPPFPVQEEIVRILDNMTSLTAELTAELKARQKQYEYYRDSLLSFEEGSAHDGVRWVKLGECCDYVDYRGKTPKKVDEGIFLVTAKNIRKGYIDYDSSQEYIAEDDYTEVMHRGVPEIGDILFTTEAPCGFVAQVDRTDIALAQRVIKYRGHKDVINNTFLKYVLLGSAFQEKLMRAATGSTVKGIKGSKLHQLTVPVPPLEEQQRIVDILDRFDKLCNDISEGLPAEIEARKKQYEYYRDKLLTFKEKEA